MIYLDNAATTFPKPDAVYNSVMECMKNYAANPGRGSHDMAIKASQKVMETREEIAEFFNISNLFNIIFTSSATEGLNIGIKGVLKEGDHVITTAMEHNSVLRPVNFLGKKGVKCTIVSADKEGYVDVKDIEKKIEANTKMIIVNHISNVTGSIQDIESIGALAKKNNIIFMVDASQSAGVMDIDVTKFNIDILALPGHKGLLGPQGTGVLYIREGLEVEEFKSGGTGSNSYSVEQPNFLPDKFESGTLNTPGIAGLCEGVKFIKKVGTKNIRKHEIELTRQLISGFKAQKYVILYGRSTIENRGAVVSFNIDGIDSSEGAALLNSKGICIRSGYHCAPLVHYVIGTNKKGTIRVSPGYFNTAEDIEKLVKAVEEIYKAKL